MKSLIISLLINYIFFTSLSFAQEKPSQPEQEVKKSQKVTREEQKAKVKSKINDLEKILILPTNDVRKLLMPTLSQTKFTLERQRQALEAQSSLEIFLTEPPVDEKTHVEPPKTFLELEAKKDEYISERAKLNRAVSQLTTAVLNLEIAKEDFANKEKERRLVVDGGGDKGDLDKSTRVQLAEAQSNLSAELVTLREIELENDKFAKQIAEKKYKLKAAEIEDASSKLVLSGKELTQKLNELQEKEKRLREELAKEQSNLHKAEKKYLETRVVSGVDLQRLASDQLKQEISFFTTDLVLKRIDFISFKKGVWKERFNLGMKKENLSELKTLDKAVKKKIEQLDEIAKSDTARLSEFRKQTLAVDAKIEAAQSNNNTKDLYWLKSQRTELDRARDAFDSYISDVDSLRRLSERFLDESDRRLGSVNVKEKLSEAKEGVNSIWTYEITSIDDRPITIGKLTTAFLLFFLGFFLSKRISKQIRKRIFPRLRMTDGVSASIESLLFYLLLIFFALFSLKLANVPLTIFTILGGALAIGVGFGSQNIMNNFISGLILLMEQPIRVGDLVELDGVTGVVIRIGLRSTGIRSSKNIDLIVPNSDFLEKRVINWTLNDRRVRLSIDVGIAYGSDTRLAEELLKKAVSGNSKVLANPMPLVWFAEFGDNSLNFETHFWCSVRNMSEKRTTESEIRFEIDALFREAKISIAFPQRDIHIDSIRPIEVKMTN